MSFKVKGSGGGFASKGNGGGFVTKVIPALSITADGLILYYDTTNLSSYPGSGTSITDLKGNSNGSMENSPAFTSNYLTLNGTNQSIKTNTDLSSFFTGSPKSEVTSIFIWVYPISAGNIVVEHGESTFANTGWIDSNIEISSGGAFSFGTWNGSNMNDKVVSSAQSFNNWYYIGWTYDGSTLTAYINGSSIGTVTYNRQAPYNYGNGLYYNIGLNCITNMGTDSYCNMRFGEFHVYNTSLTGGQVLNNFNASKNKFGL